jgi:hypothetical protein
LQQHSASGGIEEYSINNDYLNYKGTQIDHLYGGYFRGETYRVGIVFYDLLGFESFAFHLADFRFPDQSENFYNWSRIKEDGSVVYNDGVLAERAWPTNNYNLSELSSKKVFNGDTGNNLSPMDSINPSLGVNSPGAAAGESRAVSHLRIMGLDISGIDVSSISDFISGFKIVRVKREKTILVQGLVMPCVATNDNDDGPIICPLPSTHQNFFDFDQSAAPNPTSDPLNIKLVDPHAFHDEGQNDEDRFVIKSHASVMYVPSIDFGSTSFPALQSQDQFVLVGGAWDEYQNDNAPYKATWAMQWYSKQYYTKNLFHLGPSNGNPNNPDSLNVPYSSENPFPRYMSRTNIVKATPLDLGKFEEQWDGVSRLNNDIQTEDDNGDDRKAKGKNNSIYIQHGNFTFGTPSGTFAHSAIYKNSDSPKNLNHRGQSNGNSNFVGSFIFNLQRPNSNPYGGLSLSALERSIFIGTGHFQPINNKTFDAQGVPSDLIFNDIEVFGGDCYLDYHAFLRMYPHYKWDGGDDDDYSDGRVFPLEYEYNHSMREAGTAGGSGASLMWPNVGAKSGEDPPQWDAGLVYITDGEFVAEQFHLNATMNFEELLVFYSPKPLNFKGNDLFPVRWRYTREKVYGDPIDNWRLFQVNDFRDLNGQYGEITSSLYIFNQIYSWQISAFGRLRASDRALIESQQGGTLSTGIGDKLDGIDYTSTNFGNQHQWSLFGSDSAAYWADVNKRKLMKFAQDGKNPLSDIKGIHQFCEEEMPLFEDNDNPVSNLGIHGTFDYGNNEAIFTFNRDRKIRSENNASIVLLSRVPNGKTFSRYVVRQNETAVLEITQDNQAVVLPIGNTPSGINENTIMYLFIDSPYTAEVFDLSTDGLSSVSLFTTVVGEYYRLFRYSKNDSWMHEVVDADDMTPHRNSLTYNEFEDYFQGYHPYSPSHYMSTKFLVLSHDNVSGYSEKKSVYAHDLGLKGYFPSFSKKSVLSVSMNDGAVVSKVMDSLRVNCNEDFNKRFSTFLMETETQFRYMDMTSDTRKKYLEDILRFPLRTNKQKDRMRGKHILMTFEMKNNSTYNDRITNLVTYYRPSNRL